MDWQALRVSLSLGLWTLALLLPAGTAVAHALASRTFRGKRVAEALVAVPLLLPAWTVAAVLLSATLWSAGFGLYAWHYLPVLTRPRLDGKPG